MAKSTLPIDYLAKKTSQSPAWTWNEVTKIPNSKWTSTSPTQSDPSIGSSNNYNLDSVEKRWREIRVSGTRNNPLTVNFHSAIMPEASEKPLYKLAEIVNPKELTKIRTNCSEEYVSQNTFYKNIFYKWQRAGYQPLYINFHKDMSAGGYKLSDVVVSFNLSQLCS